MAECASVWHIIIIIWHMPYTTQRFLISLNWLPILIHTDLLKIDLKENTRIEAISQKETCNNDKNFRYLVENNKTNSLGRN